MTEAKAPKRGPGGASPSWTPEEDAALRANWHNGQVVTAWMHLIPNRSRGGIFMRAKKLGLGPRGKCEIETPTWTRIKELLRDGRARTAQQIAAEMTTAMRHVQGTLARFHGQGLRITGWRRAHKGRVAAWALGTEPDKPRPPRKSKQEIDRDYAKKRAKDPVRLARKADRERFRRTIRRGLKSADIAAAWIRNPIEPPTKPKGKRPRSTGDTLPRRASETPWGRTFRLDGKRPAKRAAARC